MRPALFLVLTTTLLLQVPGSAAEAGGEVKVTLGINSQKVGMNEYLTLKVNVSGKESGSASDPEISGLSGFEVVSQSSGTQISIFNMDMQRIKTYTYVIVPKKRGKTTFTATVDLDGKRYTSNSVEVVTMQSSPRKGGRRGGQPSVRHPSSLLDSFLGRGRDPSLFGRRPVAKDDFMFQARANKSEAYVGEEVIYLLYFYRSQSIWSDAQYEFPDTKGFWIENVPRSKQISEQNETVAGKAYAVSKMPLLLYPLTDGNVIIGKGNIKFQIDTFSPSMRLESNEVLLKILPLPAKGKPKEFTGLVGDYSIEAEITGLKAGAPAGGSADPPVKTEAGKPVTINITIHGKGNMHAIQKPFEPDLGIFDRFEPEITENFTRGADGSEGSKVFKYILVPAVDGSFEIGPFTTNFFDPVSKSYKKVETGIIKIDVAKSGEASTTADAVGGRDIGSVRSVAPGVNAIKPNIDNLENEERPYYSNILFWLYPAMLAALIYGIGRRLKRGEPLFGRKATPYEKGESRLQNARFELENGDTDIFFNEIRKALNIYLSEKLLIPIDEVRAETVSRKLNGNGKIPERLDEILRKCSTARFSPETPKREEMEKMVRDASEIIEQVESGT
jgi:HEPN domain-containing protein